MQREPDCVYPPTEAVFQYDGALGVSKEFVKAHQKPVGAFADLHCSGTLIARDLFLLSSDCLNFDQTIEEQVGFGAPALSGNVVPPLTYYRIDAIIEQGAVPHGLAILRLDGAPGDDWGVARLSALYAPPQQPTTFIGYDYELEFVTTGTYDYLADGMSLDINGVFSTGAGVLQETTGQVIAIVARPDGYNSLGCFATFGTPLAQAYQNSPTLRNLTLDAAKVVTVL
jgi:hypothetical protein